MSIKRILNNKFVWFFTSFVVVSVLAIMFLPSMINLNFLKPKIENVIFTKTGIKAQINGNVNFSMSGTAQIVAHDISLPNGTVSSVDFAIPMFDIFDIQNANISGDVSVNGANLAIEKIIPFDTNVKIKVYDSKIKFLNKEYDIIDAVLSKNFVDATVRTDQHKYYIKLRDNSFTVKNKNNDLKISGILLNDGTVKAHLEIIAKDINRWFEFNIPKIKGRFPVIADVFWDGGYGVRFYNISANGLTGNIDLLDNGYRIVQLQSQSADYNLSFLIDSVDILQNTSLDLDFYGKITIADKVFEHVKIITTGSHDKINIDTIILDDVKIHGGTVDKDGAHDVYVAGPLSGLHTTCLLNGTLTHWWCRKFSHGSNITSVFSVKDDVIDADVYSTAIYEDMKPFVVTIRKLASSGEVRFYYPDTTGTLYLKKDSYTVDYTRLDNKSLTQAKINPKFLPDFMKDEVGDFVWINNGIMIFTPKSKQWQLSKSADFFILRGENFKKLTKKVDLQSLNDLPFVLSGNYKNGNISDFTVEIADNKFTGMMIGKSVTLKTDVLNMDLFINKSFINKFEELSFFTNHPILLPFEANLDVALSANKLIFNGMEYDNFVYSLHKDTQTFSISDSNYGNLLASINKHNIEYAINIQLNKFMLNNKILPKHMPLNISNTFITADIKLNTYGKIASDVISNLKGTFDASFDGGFLYGLGLSDFYASAPEINLLNGEYMIYKALNGGTTKMKKMHIVGVYENEDIKTTEPFTLSMPHTDASGVLEIKNNEMTAKLKLVLRGTSAEPEPIDLTIYPDNKREFSLSEVMMHFEPEYMRVFVQTRDKF